MYAHGYLFRKTIQFRDFMICTTKIKLKEKGMKGISVFYLEDSETQRLALEMSMEEAGFEVESAGTVVEAKILLEEKGLSFDVLLLDMKLEQDPNSNGVTGASLAMEFLRNKKPAHPPEILILSGYKEVNYFERALELQVAGYLFKGDKKSQEVIQYVRAIALRRRLNILNLS